MCANPSALPPSRASAIFGRERGVYVCCAKTNVERRSRTQEILILIAASRERPHRCGSSHRVGRWPRVRSNALQSALSISTEVGQEEAAQPMQVIALRDLAPLCALIVLGG